MGIKFRFLLIFPSTQSKGGDPLSHCYYYCKREIFPTGGLFLWDWTSHIKAEIAPFPPFLRANIYFYNWDWSIKILPHLSQAKGPLHPPRDHPRQAPFNLPGWNKAPRDQRKISQRESYLFDDGLNPNRSWLEDNPSLKDTGEISSRFFFFPFFYFFYFSLVISRDSFGCYRV